MKAPVFGCILYAAGLLVSPPDNRGRRERHDMTLSTLDLSSLHYFSPGEMIG